MSRRCIIVYDEPLGIALMKKHVSMVSELTLVATCESAIEASPILQSENIDVMFLDIQMPIMTGMDLIKTIKKKPEIILTTAYREYAIESYDWDVVDYLLKPISFPRFLQSVQKLSKNITPIAVNSSLKKRHIFVQSDRKQVKILFHEVVYTESIKDYIRIHLIKQKVMCKDKISTFSEQLPPNFIGIHRSFVINLQIVTTFSKTSVSLGEVELPIGINYKKVVGAKLRG